MVEDTIYKKCGTCKDDFPLTKEFFYGRVTKKGTIINGVSLKKDSIGFKSICKACHAKKGTIRRRKKLMIKFGVTTDEELDVIIHNNRKESGLKGAKASSAVAFKMWKHDYPKDSTRAERERISRIHRLGYNLENYDVEWRKKLRQTQKENRTFVYPEGLTISERKTFYNKAIRNDLPDSIIANAIGFKLEEVPDWLIELKRKQLILYRDVKKKKNS
ncbi:MAG: hypothetical protein ACI9AT_000434 [Ulvibacter sp.]